MDKIDKYINYLLDSGLVTKNNNELRITDKGKQLLTFLTKLLKDEDLKKTR